MKEVFVNVKLYQLHGFAILVVMPAIFFVLPFFLRDACDFVGESVVFIALAGKLERIGHARGDLNAVELKERPLNCELSN